MQTSAQHVDNPHRSPGINSLIDPCMLPNRPTYSSIFFQKNQSYETCSVCVFSSTSKQVRLPLTSFPSLSLLGLAPVAIHMCSARNARFRNHQSSCERVLHASLTPLKTEQRETCFSSNQHRGHTSRPGLLVCCRPFKERRGLCDRNT
jgi:hypothetical protein